MKTLLLSKWQHIWTMGSLSLTFSSGTKKKWLRPSLAETHVQLDCSTQIRHLNTISSIRCDNRRLPRKSLHESLGYIPKEDCRFWRQYSMFNYIQISIGNCRHQNRTFSRSNLLGKLFIRERLRPVVQRDFCNSTHSPNKSIIWHLFRCANQLMSPFHVWRKKNSLRWIVSGCKLQ